VVSMHYERFLSDRNLRVVFLRKSDRPDLEVALSDLQQTSREKPKHVWVFEGTNPVSSQYISSILMHCYLFLDISSILMHCYLFLDLTRYYLSAKSLHDDA
jgi:hypothetical protein